MQTTHQMALEAKHASLDRLIADENARPVPDALALADLKRRKLRLKEEFTAD